MIQLRADAENDDEIIPVQHGHGRLILWVWVQNAFTSELIGSVEVCATCCKLATCR
jgi:hypothetical protein